jgi:hypothetical protein
MLSMICQNLLSTVTVHVMKVLLDLLIIITAHVIRVMLQLIEHYYGSCNQSSVRIYWVIMAMKAYGGVDV